MDKKSALITGASSGIGAELARLLGEKNYTVHLAARRVEKMEDIAGDIDGKGATAEVHSLDLQSPESIKTLAEELGSREDPPAVLVNNAGYGIYGRVDQIPVDDARDLFETNFMGTMDLTRRAIKWMKRGGGGRIVNVTSGVAKRGFPIMNYYSASKAALESMSESMRLELEPFDITVQVVYPIRTDTEFSGSAHRFVPDDFEFPSHGPTQTAREVAEAIADGLKTDRFRIHPHYSSKFLGTLNEWFPSFVEYMTDLRSLVEQTLNEEPH